MVDIHGVTAGIVNSFYLEINDAITRQKISSMISSALMASGEFHEIKVVCDETNNTPIVVDSGYCPAVDIYFKTKEEHGKVRTYNLPSQPFPVE